MMMSRTIHALIFDFDGLILDTESTMFISWQEIYAGYGLEIQRAEWAKMLGRSSDPGEAYDYLEQHLGRPVDRAGLKARRIARELALLEGQGPMPGVRSLIEECEQAGMPIALASSSEHDWVDGHLERMGLAQYFDAVVCAEDVAATKPDPDLYLQALRELRLKSSQAIALEDSDHGVQAARAAGIICIAVPNVITREASFDGAKVILNTLEGVHLGDLLRLALE
jgi:HAD superfamily hydrolase (TIGR01509 family)